jgi:hypothetical protein
VAHNRCWPHCLLDSLRAQFDVLTNRLCYRISALVLQRPCSRSRLRSGAQTPRLCKFPNGSDTGLEVKPITFALLHSSHPPIYPLPFVVIPSVFRNIAILLSNTTSENRDMIPFPEIFFNSATGLNNGASVVAPNGTASALIHNGWNVCILPTEQSNQPSQRQFRATLCIPFRGF